MIQQLKKYGYMVTPSVNSADKTASLLSQDYYCTYTHYFQLNKDKSLIDHIFLRIFPFFFSVFCILLKEKRSKGNKTGVTCQSIIIEDTGTGYSLVCS